MKDLNRRLGQTTLMITHDSDAAFLRRWDCQNARWVYCL